MREPAVGNPRGFEPIGGLAGRKMADGEGRHVPRIVLEQERDALVIHDVAMLDAMGRSPADLPALRPVAAFCPPRRGLPEFRPGRTAPLRPQIRGPRHYFRPDPTSGIDPKPRHLVRALDCKIRPSATMPDR